MTESSGGAAFVAMMQPADFGAGDDGARRGMSRDTVRSETASPSFTSSPWIRGAPHNRLAPAISPK